MGTYSIDSITKYINFYEIIRHRNTKYPFAVFNTEKESEPGKQWWSFLDIHPKNNLFLFDSFGLEGFKLFDVDNDKQIINDLLFNFKRCESKSNKKLTLCNMKFCVETWQKNAAKNKKSFNRNCTKSFYLLGQFAKLIKSQCMNIIILENAVQNLLSATCGSFQLYFYKNLFDPYERSKILNCQRLTKNTLQITVNEIFSTDLDENEYLIKKFNEEYDL